MRIATLALTIVIGASVWSCAREPEDSTGSSTTTGTLDRTVLPIPEPEYAPITELDARNAQAPPPFAVGQERHW